MGQDLEKSQIIFLFVAEIFQIFCSMNTSDAIGFIDKVSFDGSKSEIWSKIYPEIKSRLDIFKEVGLSYLTLDRSAPTLSGGEAQRIRLTATQLGADLTGVTYVLDEPTIGLHPSDNARLVESLRKLERQR